MDRKAVVEAVRVHDCNARVRIILIAEGWAMQNQDIRWVQRLDSFSRALVQLDRAAALAAERKLSELEQQGLIQAFEFTHELAWKTMKDFIEERGASVEIFGSKDATREAFRLGLIENGEIWMAMIVSRNRSSHTYDRATADELAQAILGAYVREFRGLEKRMSGLRGME